MTKPNDGGPAFPVPEVLIESESICHPSAYQGMSIRDWFAGMALQGILASPRTPVNKSGEASGDSETIAYLSYVMADAMLKERERNE